MNWLTYYCVFGLGFAMAVYLKDDMRPQGLRDWLWTLPVALVLVAVAWFPMTAYGLLTGKRKCGW